MKKTLHLAAISAALTLTSLALHAQSANPSPTPAATPNYVAQVRGSTDANSLAASTVVAIVPQAVAIDFQAVQRAALLLWRDPSQAQAIVDKMGEKGAPIFIMYGEMIGPLSVIDPGAYAKLTKPPTGYGWTILPAQANGTWTAGARSVLITYTPAGTP